MPPIPPNADLLPQLQLTILPAVGGAAFVVCAFLLLGRWASALGSAAAIVAAFVWANYAFPSQFKTCDFDTPLDTTQWGTGRLIPWKIDEDTKPWHWLPRASLALVIVGLLSRWAGLLVGWLMARPGQAAEPNAPPTRGGAERCDVGALGAAGRSEMRRPRWVGRSGATLAH